MKTGFTRKHLLNYVIMIVTIYSLCTLHQALYILILPHFIDRDINCKITQCQNTCLYKLGTWLILSKIKITLENYTGSWGKAKPVLSLHHSLLVLLCPSSYYYY